MISKNRIITFIVLLIPLLVSITAVKFTIDYNQQIFQSLKNTIDMYSDNIVDCAKLCSTQNKCCVASFEKLKSTCRIDTSENCSITTRTDTGCDVLYRKLYVPPSCTNCYSYTASTYTVIEDQVDWETARDNCYNKGGKLAELETIEENDFIKHTLTVRNSNVANAYFLGGYKFNPSDGFRWISTPSQSWTFKDFGIGEAINPTEMCLGSLVRTGFQWADVPCDWLRPYICEFSDCNALHSYQTSHMKHL